MTKISSNARSDFRQFLLMQHSCNHIIEFKMLHIKLLTVGLDLIELQIYRMLHESGYIHHIILKQ